MKEYQGSYCILWKGICYALNEMEHQNYGSAKEILIQAQLEAEKCFIEWQPNEREENV